MKLLVMTMGAFQLRLEDTRELVRAQGATLVSAGSGFLNEQVARNRVEILEKVSDEATQADWDDTLKESDGDLALARQAFVSEFPVDGAGDRAPAGEGSILPVTQTGPGVANPPGQTGGLAPDVKPAAPGQTEGPGGPKDTNKGEAKHSTHKKS